MVEQIFHPFAGHDWRTDLGPLWVVRPATYATVYAGTNFFCFLAIFYVIYRVFRTVRQAPRDSAP
jgi:hypothetical protein